MTGGQSEDANGVKYPVSSPSSANKGYSESDINNIALAIDDGELTVAEMPAAITRGKGATELSELSDVNINSVSDEQILQYDSTSEKWVNTNLPTPEPGDLDSLTDVTISSPTNDQYLKYNSTTQQWENQEGPTPGPSALSELDDVTLSSVTNQQILQYNSTSDTWVNANLPAPPTVPTVLEDLSNVDITTPTNDQYLKYNSTSSKWENATMPAPPVVPSDLSDLGDVAISSPTNDQYLKYNATTQKWENQTGGGSGGASELDELDDVTITSPANNDVLKYNSSTQEWENAPESGGTTVIPNPQGTATADLNKVQIDSTIYGIPNGADALPDLSDVNIDTQTLANDQALAYDSTTQKWINKNIGGGTGATTWEGTQAEYDAIANPDPDTIYFITDGNPSGGGGVALKTLYNTWTPFDANSTITFSEDITQYDEIRIYSSYHKTDTGDYYIQRKLSIIDSETIKWSIAEQTQTGDDRGKFDFIGVFESTNVYVAWVAVASHTSLTCKIKSYHTLPPSTVGVEKIIGVKYLSSSSETQSFPYVETKSQSGSTPVEFNLPGTNNRTTRITITGTVYAPSVLLGFDATVGAISNSDLTTTETSAYHWSYLLSFDITCGRADGRIIYNGALNAESVVTASLSYIAGSISSVHNYSNDERIVGTWVDGRPVYEKTVYNAGGRSGDFFLPHGITDLDRVISCQSSYYDNNSGTSGAIGLIPRIENYSIGIIAFTSTDIQIRVPTVFGVRIVDWYFVIRYIKTQS